MLQWLFLAAIAAAAVAEPGASPTAVHRESYHRDDRRHHGLDHRREGHDHRREDHDQHREGHDHRHEDHDQHREGHDHRHEDHDQHREGHDHRRDHQHKDHDDDDHVGPNVARLFDPSRIAFDPHNPRHKKIIENVYSPDYYQPTWILDYRYQKTGGRGYTRADGGQVLILPKKHHSQDKDYTYTNYDELLEFLRLKQLSESQAHRLHKPERKGHETHHDHDSHGRKEHRDNREWQKEPSLRSHY